jgi:RimJ/RimL family protein N-acetyltransferase
VAALAPPDLAPLGALRLVTPRLELRLGDPGEILALGRLAEDGIHPPDRMPFAVPWTDRAGEPDFLDSFVEFHAQARRAWRPEAWDLHLLVRAGGELVGTQTLSAEDLATGRTVSTGSWLGRRFQGRGIGTEMRAAVLELAFRGLGAEAACSGALAGNDASLRVSEKLGYVQVGTSTVAPRGELVDHRDLRLERAAWRAPVPVEIEGLAPCLALFGIG